MDGLRRRISEWNERAGPTLSEYGVILLILVVIAYLALALVGDQTSHILSTVSGPI